MEKSRSANRQKIQVLEKAFLIQEYIANHSEGISLAELSADLQMNKSTIFRILDTLVDLGYVIRSPETEKYRLGYKYFILSNAAISINLREHLQPVMRRLAGETGEVVHLSVLDNDAAVCIGKYETATSNSIVIKSQIGRRSPLHASASGKIFLTYIPDNKMRDIISHTGLYPCTKNTITEMSRLERELEHIRKDGYAIDELEQDDNLRCVAAPVFDIRNRIVAAISVTGTVFSFTQEKIPVMANAVKRYAMEASQLLGYEQHL